jgi:hypothetical protein
LSAIMELPFGFDEIDKLLQVAEFLDNREELLEEFKPEVTKFLVKGEFFKGAFRHKYNSMFDALIIRLIKRQLVQHFPSFTPEEIMLLTEPDFLKMVTEDFYFQPDNYKETPNGKTH